jgi:Tfp pilus assembly protein PilN
MRPVNLLPADLRPSHSTGGRSGSAYVLVGALAAALVAALVLVVFSNQVASREDELAELQQEAASARAEAGPLAPFGEFAQVKETRIASVRSLAGGRLDWERLMRELALVLPKRTWLTSFTGSTGAGAGEAAAGGAGEAAAGGAADTAVTGPEVTLSGCAPRQRDVAEAMVRLRRVDGFRDVTLAESSRSARTDAAAQPGQAQTVTPAGAASANTAGCGDMYSFEVSLKLEPPQAAAGDEQVPVRLGGGS